VKILEALYSLRLESGALWGDAAAPFQITDAQAVVDMDGPRRHWIGRPRGSSKTADVAGILLAELVCGAIPRSNPAYAAAADRDQGRLLLDSVSGYVDRTGLRSLVDVQSYRAVHKGSGASIEVLAGRLQRFLRPAALQVGLRRALPVVRRTAGPQVLRGPVDRSPEGQGIGGRCDLDSRFTGPLVTPGLPTGPR